LLVIVVLGLVQSILLPFATGFVIAYVLAPMVHLDRRGVPRSLGSLLVLILFLVGFARHPRRLVPLIRDRSSS
jgi:predicted PurR-regulated permease PerM